MKRETKYPPAFETNDRSILGSGNTKRSLVVGMAAKLTGFFIGMSPIRRSLKIVFHCLLNCSQERWHRQLSFYFFFKTIISRNLDNIMFKKFENHKQFSLLSRRNSGMCAPALEHKYFHISNSLYQSSFEYYAHFCLICLFLSKFSTPLNHYFNF